MTQRDRSTPAQRRARKAAEIRVLEARIAKGDDYREARRTLALAESAPIPADSFGRACRAAVIAHARFAVALFAPMEAAR